MDKYRVVISSQALRELDGIYEYISLRLLEPGTASNLADALETAILNLNIMPYRGSERKIGRFAGKGYRQLFVNGYTIVYRIDEDGKQVTIITVRYSRSDF